MAKVGILTFHNACNFGAVLQTYALKTYLQKSGEHDIEVINYHNVQIECEKALFKNLLQNNWLKEIIRNILLLPYGLKRNAIFNQFVDAYLCKSQEIQKDELKKLKKDAYIVGSDQVWNLELTKNDTSFFLDFINENELCYSYAASIGKSKFTNEEIIQLSELLVKFRKISFREKELVPIFQEKLKEKEIVACLDPVYLLDVKEWEKISVCPMRKPYLLFFGVGSNPELEPTIEFAKKMAIEKGLELVYLSDQDIWYKHREWMHCGAITPMEFLGYIRNAEYVVTNSFHATAFSIIFHKQFYSETGLGRNGRIINILEITDLQSRALIKGVLEKEELIEHWENVDDRLEIVRRDSKKYLESILDEIVLMCK